MAPGWTLETVISGGQTGADQAGIAAARFLNFATGGRAPKDFMTEDGPAPWLAEFGLTAAPVASLKSRTYYNVTHSDGTLIFTQDVLTFGTTRAARRAAVRKRTAEAAGGLQALTPDQIFDSFDLQRGSGSRYTAELALAHQKPFLLNPAQPEEVRDWLDETRIRTLNIAGTRESRAPGIFRWVYDFLLEGLLPF